MFENDLRRTELSATKVQIKYISKSECEKNNNNKEKQAMKKMNICLVEMFLRKMFSNGKINYVERKREQNGEWN